MRLPLQVEIAALGFVEDGSKSEEALQLSINSLRAQAFTATPFANQENKYVGKDVYIHALVSASTLVGDQRFM